jgi:hypothetical protein
VGTQRKRKLWKEKLLKIRSKPNGTLKRGLSGDQSWMKKIVAEILPLYY